MVMGSAWKAVRVAVKLHGVRFSRPLPRFWRVKCDGDHGSLRAP